MAKAVAKRKPGRKPAPKAVPAAQARAEAVVRDAYNFTLMQRLGIGLGEIPEAQPGVVQGFRMARNPSLVKVRKACNAAEIAAGIETLIMEAQERLHELTS